MIVGRDTTAVGEANWGGGGKVRQSSSNLTQSKPGSPLQVTIKLKYAVIC